MADDHAFRLSNGATLVVDLEAGVAEWRIDGVAVSARQLLRHAPATLREDATRATRRACAVIRARAAGSATPADAAALRELATRLWEAHRAVLAGRRPDGQQALPGF
jgi:hypothetical protein